jgi:hypothetical protein
MRHAQEHPKLDHELKMNGDRFITKIAAFSNGCILKNGDSLHQIMTAMARLAFGRNYISIADQIEPEIEQKIP